MDGNTHAQRKWFVIDVNQHSGERAPVLSGREEQRVTEGDGRGIGGTPILGAVAFVVVLVAVVLLVVLV